jgi:hypothetical protein
MPYAEGSVAAMKSIFLNKLISLLLLNLFLWSHMVGSIGSAYAQQDWKQEYEAVCAKTQNAMTLSAAELKKYIERCDKLQDRLDELAGMEGETEKKVYEKRLKMCRDLYKFTLEYKVK